MEQDSSFNTQLRKKITARAVMSKGNKILEVDIDEKIQKMYDVILEIKKIKKLIPKKSKKIKTKLIFL